MSDKAPLKILCLMTLAAVAAGSDASRPVAIAPFAGKVSKVSYVPVSAINGADTNTRTLSVKNRAQDGSGTVVVGSLALTNGVNAAAFDEKALTLSATAADLVVAKGDVLSFESIKSGTGLADPGGMVVIEFTRS